jgi:hypothetical protein
MQVISSVLSLALGYLLKHWMTPAAPAAPDPSPAPAGSPTIKGLLADAAIQLEEMLAAELQAAIQNRIKQVVSPVAGSAPAKAA